LAATVLLNGLTLAALYFIVASGFSLIFGLMRTVNMAHGSLYMLGAYLGYAVFEPMYDVDSPYAWYAGIAVAVAAAAAFGVLMQVTLLGWMQGQELRQALVTIGVRSSWPTSFSPIWWHQPAVLRPRRHLRQHGGAGIGRYPTFRLVQIGIAVAVGVALWLLLNKTKLGLMIRAGVDDRQMLAGDRRASAAGGASGLRARAGPAGLGGVIGSTAPAAGAGGRFALPAHLARRGDRGRHGLHRGHAVGAILVGVAEQWGRRCSRPTASS
jgi:branched-chain amino acid transport system permease protein